MLEFVNDMPITLEALNAEGDVLSDMAASLRHLDGERAIVALSSGIPTPYLHWGTQVRFQLVDGLRRYDIFGTVVAHDLPRSRKASDSAGAEAPLPCEATLRLRECRLADQRRGFPRRPANFNLLFHPLKEGKTTSPRPSPSQGEEEGEATPPDRQAWQEAICVDLGGGGMRLRVRKLTALPKRIALRFTLPSLPGEEGTGQEFTLQGRILRAAPYGRHTDDLEIAVRFEQLSVAEGLALASHLS